jgi:hypothetical protein
MADRQFLSLEKWPLALQSFHDLMALNLLQLSAVQRTFVCIFVLFIMPCSSMHISLINRLYANPVIRFFASPGSRVFVIELLLRPDAISVSQIIWAIAINAVSFVKNQ